ncbi:hypothetical protein ACFVMC_22920 [Nocardia sp. NPDC127579]|uniref:hypothetical protein n=1 Tax=Nocardia sp. NPDC127579 TaxID=3345402 RepID=UPI00363DF861
MTYKPFIFTNLGFNAKHELLNIVCETLFHQLPAGWAAVTIDYRQVGHHVETVSVVHTIDQRIVPIETPTGARELFPVFRNLMSRPHEGTWYSLRFHYARMGESSIETNWTEDPFTKPVPAQAFLDEQRIQWLEKLPDWFPGQSLRKAKRYDLDEWEMEANEREPLPAAVAEQVAAYLRDAPVAHTDDDPWIDPLDPEEPEIIPPNFYTDGTWIWTEDVPFQLRVRNMSPEPDFVEHIAANNFRFPDIDTDTVLTARLQAIQWIYSGLSDTD